MLAFLLLLAAQAAPEVRATLTAEPARAAVGQPVTLTLVVERPAALELHEPLLAEGVHGSWCVLEALGTRRAPGTAAGSVVETARWNAIALEGGVALPEITLRWTTGGAEQTLRAAAAPVDVAIALAEGEDAPRPAPGFREPIAWSGGAARLVWVAAGLALLLGGWIALRIARGRRGAVQAQAPAPEARLAELVVRARQDPDAGRDVLYGLTRLVREAVDARSGEARVGETDGEWIRRTATDTRIPAPARDTARRLLERAERFKYAAEAPTRFAVDEALADARGVLDALAAAEVAAGRAA